MTERPCWTFHHGPSSLADALDRTHELASWVRDEEGPDAVLHTTPLDGASIALGRYQRAEHALRLEEANRLQLSVARRMTGGPASWAGKGVLYSALVLRHRSSLMMCPRERVLNRNVRGFLSGLSGPLPAHYFGRETISAASRPIALIGWTARSDGTTVVEAFIAVSAPFSVASKLDGYPRSAAPWMGKTPAILEDLWNRAVDVGEVAERLAQGHAERFKRPFVPAPRSLSRVPGPAADDVPPSNTDATPLRWSAPQSIPIGFVAGGLSLDVNGAIRDVAIAGDFFCEEGAEAELRRRLVGSKASDSAFIAALNACYGRDGFVLEGVKHLDSIRAVLNEAATLWR